MPKLVLFLACVLAFLTHAEADSDELLSLSLKELLAIPVDRPYEGEGVFQSEKHKVTKESVNVGLLIPLTSWPRYSAQLIAAADLAVEYVNENGGINGRPLAIIRADTDNTVNQSYVFADELVTKYNAQALIGPVASDEASQVLKNINLKHKIPMFSYASSANSLSQISGGQYFWRLVASNDQQVSVLAQTIKENPSLNKIFIIGSTDIYSQEIISGIKQKLPNAKLKEWIFSAKVDPDLFDIEAESEAIQSFNPQAILLFTKARHSDILLAKLIKHWKGNFPLIFTGDNFQFYDLNDALAKSTRLCVKTLISKKPMNAQFKHQLEALTQLNITDLDSAYVFDSIVLFAMAKQLEFELKVSHSQAIKRLTSDGQSVGYENFSDIKKLYQLHGELSYQGVSGQVKFNQIGNNVTAKMDIQKSGLGCH